MYSMYFTMQYTYEYFQTPVYCTPFTVLWAKAQKWRGIHFIFEEGGRIIPSGDFQLKIGTTNPLTGGGGQLAVIGLESLHLFTKRPATQKNIYNLTVGDPTKIFAFI